MTEGKANEQAVLIITPQGQCRMASCVIALLRFIFRVRRGTDHDRHDAQVMRYASAGRRAGARAAANMRRVLVNKRSAT
jgi:hypothetical protein